MVWHLVITTTNKKNSINTISSVLLNGDLITDTVTIANSFNSFFSTMGQSKIRVSMDEDFLRNSLSNQTQDTLEKTTLVCFQFISTHEINKLIKSLKSKDSYGYDEVTARILKKSAPYIVPNYIHIQ